MDIIRSTNLFIFYLIKGRPIYIEVIGDINVEELFQNTSEERLLKYYVRGYERLLKVMFPACSNHSRKLIEKSLSILDMKDQAMKFMYGNVRRFLKLRQRNLFKSLLEWLKTIIQKFLGKCSL